MELEHRAYWAVKQLNMDMQVAREKRMLQMNGLDEFRMDAFENAKLYKKRTKRLHGKYI